MFTYSRFRGLGKPLLLNWTPLRLVDGLAQEVRHPPFIQHGSALEFLAVGILPCMSACTCVVEAKLSQVNDPFPLAGVRHRCRLVRLRFTSSSRSHRKLGLCGLRRSPLLPTHASALSCTCASGPGHVCGRSCSGEAHRRRSGCWAYL